MPGATGQVAAHFEIDNRVEINSLGFYDAEPGPDEAAPRVLVVGDSFTAAMNVERPAVWTAVLERALRDGGQPRADVVNLGLDGTGTDVHAALLREYVPRFSPDTVLIAFYAGFLGQGSALATPIFAFYAVAVLIAASPPVTSLTAFAASRSRSSPAS